METTTYQPEAIPTGISMDDTIARLRVDYAFGFLTDEDVRDHLTIHHYVRFMVNTGSDLHTLVAKLASEVTRDLN